MRQSIAILALFICGPVLAAEPDILVADFEGPDYGDWKATGEAFGPGPARGTLPDQMDVSGFEGKGLVNSFYKGDGTTGTLDFAADQNRAEVPQLPARRRDASRQDLHQPAGRWQGGPHAPPGRTTNPAAPNGWTGTRGT